MRKYTFLLSLCLLLLTNISFGQSGNPNSYKIALNGFQVPSNVTLNSTIKVSGYIENIGTLPIPPGFLMNFHVGNVPLNVVQGILPSFAFGQNMGVILPGASVYYEEDILIDERYFSTSDKNIVTIWPLMSQQENLNQERIFQGEITVDSGFSQRFAQEEQLEGFDNQAVVDVYPTQVTDMVFVGNRTESQDIRYVIAYDMMGSIQLEKSVEIVSNTTSSLNLSSLERGSYKLSFFDSRGKLMLTRTVVKAK